MQDIADRPEDAQMADSPQGKAIEIIRLEHRQLTGTLILLDCLMADVSSGKQNVDFGLIATILCYIDSFPDQFHHPKEERYLFAAIRRRTNEAAALIERFSEEHRTSDRMLLGLFRTFVAYQAKLPGSCNDFLIECAAYTRFQVEHMQAEEEELIPLARKYLTERDWFDIHQAFAANQDPARGMRSSQHFETLRRHIADLCPIRFRDVFQRYPPPIDVD